MKNSFVIGCPDSIYSENQVIYYRKKFQATKSSEMKICIFADSKYKFYVNGHFVVVGPAKGNDLELYYDEIELVDCFHNGENEIEVRVLSLAPAQLAGEHRFITSLRRNSTGGLEISGTLDDEMFITDKTWECAVQRGVSFFAPEYAYYTGIPEYIKSDLYNELKWKNVVELCCEEKNFTYGEPSAWYSIKSPVPMVELRERQIRLSNNKVFDFGCLTTAYLQIKIRGKGKIKITYAERCVKDGSDDRTDTSGKIVGDYDILEVDGELTFEPYWFRCFRFISVESVGTAEITEATAYETGYPLKTEEDYDFGSKADNKLWEISERTLRLCMHDTFNDCPYYEQLQYAMDTYLQCIYAYQISGDDRLQRRAIRDFAVSANADGLTQSRSPSMQKQFIPCFALYYVLMVLEHFKRFRDKNLLIQNMPRIIGVFEWYKKYSGEDLLVRKSEFWHFIDWSSEFADTRGVPTMEEGAALGVESLILSFALKETAKYLYNTEYESLSKEYSDWSYKINKAVNALLFDDERYMYANTERKQHFCQQMQIWAILSGCADKKQSKQIMKNSFSLKNAQATFAYAYFLFRALEKVDLYDMRRDMVNSLKKLIEYGCTTIPETPENARSECHAWGAVILYEFTAMDLGVKQVDGKIVINPYVKDKDIARGTVFTGLGKVYVSWEKHEKTLYIKYRLPKNVKADIVENGEYKMVIEKLQD